MREMTEKTRRPLLCLILEREGVLKPQQIAAALKEWEARKASRPVSFGQVILGLGLLSPAALAPCLAMQRRLATAPGARPLGVLLIENGCMKPSEVLSALGRLAPGQRLGELLRAENRVSRPQLDMLLMMQRVAAKAA